MPLTQLIRGPVAAQPVTGRRSVVVRADTLAVELHGHCGVCGNRVSERLAGDRLAWRLAGRRRFLLGPRPWVVLGGSLPCDRCGYPVTWMAARRDVRPLERNWSNGP